MPTTFIKVPKRTDCFTHFPKLTYLHMHRNMHMRFSVSQQSKVNIPSAPIKGRDTQKLTTDLHKNTVPTPAVSEGCTFLNAEARKNTQNTTHIDMETQLQKAQLNFHHLHQKTQWRRTGYLPWRQQLQFFCAKLLHLHQWFTSSALCARLTFLFLFSPKAF